MDWVSSIAIAGLFFLWVRSKQKTRGWIAVAAEWERLCKDATDRTERLLKREQDQDRAMQVLLERNTSLNRQLQQAHAFINGLAPTNQPTAAAPPDEDPIVVRPPSTRRKRGKSEPRDHLATDGKRKVKV